MKRTGLLGQLCADAATGSAARTTARTTDSFFMGILLERKAILAGTMNAISKVGMVGLGRMGVPMAEHLLAMGFSVAGCDPAPQARARAESLGVKVLASARDVARASELVLVVVGF